MGDGLSGRPGAGAFLLDEDMRVATGVSLLTTNAFQLGQVRDGAGRAETIHAQTETHAK